MAASLKLRKERWELLANGTVCRILRLEHSHQGAPRRPQMSQNSLWSGSTLSLRAAFVQGVSGERQAVDSKQVRLLPQENGRVKLDLQFPTVKAGERYVFEVEERQDAGAAGSLGFSPMHVFAASEYIEKDIFEVAVDKEMKLTWVARRMGKKAKPKVTKKGRLQTWQWVYENLQPEKKELLAPPLLRRAPVVRTTLLSTWQPVSQWLGGLLEDNIRPTAEVAELALHLAGHLKSDLEKVKAVHKGLKDRLRHVGLNVSTAVDLTGHKAKKVLKRGYGDCVDRSVLLSALLRVVDVSCEPVFLCTKGHRAFDPEIATPYCGDHCIVKTEGDFGTLFFDPGASYHRLGDLPATEQGVIAYSPISASMYRTPQSTSGDNGIDVEINGSVESSGTIKGTFFLEAHGEDEAQLRRLCAKSLGPERKERLRKFLRLPPQATISSVLLKSKPSKLDETFSISGRFQVSRAAEELGELMIFSPPGHKATALEVASKNRSAPILYRAPTTHRVRSVFAISKKWQVLLSPKDSSLQCPAAHFRRTVSTTKDKLVIEDIYERKAREINQKQYKEYKALLENRAATSNEPYVLSLRGKGKKASSLAKNFTDRAEQKTPAEVLLREVQVAVSAVGKQKITIQEVIAIHEEAGRQAGDIVIPLPRQGRLKELIAFTQTVSGKRFDVDKSSQRTVPNGLALSFSGIQKGARLFWRAVMELPCGEGKSYGHLAFTKNLPVKKARMQILGPANEELKAEVKTTQKNTLKKMEKQAKSQRYILFDGSLKGPCTLRYSLVPSWLHLAKSIDKELRGDIKKTPKSFLSLVKEKKKDEAVFLKTLGRLNALCATTGRKPSSLLRAAIIAKNLDRNKGNRSKVYLLAKEEWSHAKDSIVTLAGFDEAIIERNGKWFYPGQPPAPPGVIPDRFAGAHLLSVVPPLGYTGQLPGSQKGKLFEELKVRVLGDGTLLTEVERTVEGPFADKMCKHLAKGGKHYEELVSQHFKRWYPQSTVSHVKLTKAEGQQQALQIGFDLQLPKNALKLSDGRCLVRIPTFPHKIPGKISTYSRRCRLEGPRGMKLGKRSVGRTIDGQMRRLVQLSKNALLLEEEGLPVLSEMKDSENATNGAPLVEFVPKDQL